MSRYLITLKPLGKYYFGGDMTFQVGPNEKNEFNEAFASYIIASNLFPQQTSLLGMMRYLLLTKSPAIFSQKSNRIINSQNAIGLIGKESFKVFPDKHDKLNEFGLIKTLEPCFIKNETDVLLPAPKDYHFNISFDENNVTAFYNGRALKLPKIDGYSAKKSYDTFFIGVKSQKKYKDDEIFQKDIRIGINKDYKGKSDEKGFYKQISYRLKEGFHFAFVVDSNFDLKNCHNEIVSLGADGSRFSLSASELKEDEYILNYHEDELKGVEGGVKVILLSDTFLDDSDLQTVNFSITETKPFRFLCTNVETKNYNILGDAKLNAKRINTKYYLYDKGSVFYFSDRTAAEKFGQLIIDKKEFHQIGYNYYIIK